VAEGLMDKITPFISPTYSSRLPKSVRSVMIDMCVTVQGSRFKVQGLGLKSEPQNFEGWFRFAQSFL